MQSLLDDADMGGMLATWYMQLHSGAPAVPASLYALLRTSHSCRNCIFIRLVLQHTKNRNVATHNTKNAARVASIYLNLALSNAQYRRDYYKAMFVFFGMFPQFVAPLTLSDTRHCRGIRQHVNSLVAGSGILHVLALHFSRHPHAQGVRGPRPAAPWWVAGGGGCDNAQYLARMFQDLESFSCGVLCLYRCITVHNNKPVFPPTSQEFALNVTHNLLENTRHSAGSARLHIHTTQLMSLLSPPACVARVLDHLVHSFCVLMYTQPPPPTECQDKQQIWWTQRHNLEQHLLTCTETVTSQHHLALHTANYFARLPAPLHRVLSAGMGMVCTAAAAQHCPNEPHDVHKMVQQQATLTTTHMNILCLLGIMLARYDSIPADQVLAICRYVGCIAESTLVGIVSHNIVLVLCRVVCLCQRNDIAQDMMLHIVIILKRVSCCQHAGGGALGEEAVAILAECMASMVARHQQQMCAETWDAVNEVACTQLCHLAAERQCLGGRFMDLLVASMRYISGPQFERVLRHLKPMYASFGPPSGLTARDTRQLMQLLKIPFFRGFVYPKTAMQQLFSDLGVAERIQEFARVYMSIDNTAGKHTRVMISVAHTMFLLIHFQVGGLDVRDVALRLAAKMLQASNLQPKERHRTHMMLLQLVQRHHPCVPEYGPWSSPGFVHTLVHSLIAGATQGRRPVGTKERQDRSCNDHAVVLTILSSLIAHGNHHNLLCLCTPDSATSAGTLACHAIYRFCWHVLADINMTGTDVHRHGMFVAQHILRRMVGSRTHLACDPPPPSLHSSSSQLACLHDIHVYITQNQHLFTASMYSAGISDNAEIRKHL